MENEGNRRKETAWQGVALSWAGGAAGILALTLLCLAPEDGAPLGWAFWATKIGGLAVLVGADRLYRWTVKRYGGEGDEA